MLPKEGMSQTAHVGAASYANESPRRAIFCTPATSSATVAKSQPHSSAISSARLVGNTRRCKIGSPETDIRQGLGHFVANRKNDLRADNTSGITKRLQQVRALLGQRNDRIKLGPIVHRQMFNDCIIEATGMTLPGLPQQRDKRRKAPPRKGLDFRT